MRDRHGMIRKIGVVGCLLLLVLTSCDEQSTGPENHPPVASAGPNQTVLIGATVQLNGTGSSDPDGEALSPSWQLVSRPGGSTSNLSGTTTMYPSFVADVGGAYAIRLQVSDQRASDADTVDVFASGIDPIPPYVPTGNREGHQYATGPRPGYSGVIGWLYAFHDTRLGGGSLIEVRSLRLYACIAGQQTLLADSVRYPDTGELTGRLYAKEPTWFEPLGLPIPGEFHEGIVSFRPSDVPDKIFHMWNYRWCRAEVPAGADSFFVECEVRVTGPALFRVGIDFWETPCDTICPACPDDIPPFEYGTSDFVFADPGWQHVTAGRPCP